MKGEWKEKTEASGDSKHGMLRIIMIVDEMFDKTYWIVDILPEQVPKDSAGQYFAIEEYFLKEPQISELRKGMARIILKLNCYYDIYVINEIKEEVNESAVRNPNPDDLINLFSGEHAVDRVCILVEGEDALIVSNRDETYLTVYGPTSRLLNVISILAQAEGMHVWRPSN